MSRKLTLPLLLLCFCLPVVGQNLGDQSSAGFTNARTYANVDLPSLRPPLRLFETVPLSGMTSANSLAVFENQFLVGQPGSPITYKFYDRQGTNLWTQTLVGNSATFRFVPAFSNSLVILGGEATTSVKAVQISDGTVLWGDMAGNTNGRFPAVTDNFAVYAGSDKIVARNLSGTDFWQQAVTTAASALAVRDDSLYFLTRDRGLRAINLGTNPPGPKWATIVNVASDGASLIATEKYLFVHDPTNGIVAAIGSASGLVLWSNLNLPGTFSTTPALALAYGRLYVFRANDGSGHAAVTALDANTGEEIWSIAEADTGLTHGFIADNIVYYYQDGQIRARDAATGVLLWSILKSDVRGLSAANGELYVLLASAIEVYLPSNEIFMAQLANGSGQTTLIMLANPNPRPVDATVFFYGDDGAAVSVPVRNFGLRSQVSVTIPANSSLPIQTQDDGGSLVVGWVRVVSDERLRGTADFQYTEQQDILREAGVGDSLPIGAANVFVSVGGGFNAGVAIANPTEQGADLTLRLLNSLGVELASQTLSLASGGHIAQFVHEVFPTEVGTAFEGTLIIESDVPIVITAIRTKGGLQISSYPVGQAVR